MHKHDPKDDQNQADKVADATEEELIQEQQIKNDGDAEETGPSTEPEPMTDANKDEAEELKEQLLRVKADFDNFKRRSAEERAQVASVARADVVLEILPVVDNFDRAFKEEVPKEVEESNWYQGIKAIKQQFESLLGSLGIDRIESVGKPFDPAVHEAISHEASNDHDKDIISEEFEAGYKLGEDVIRHAKVKVSSGKEN